MRILAFSDWRVQDINQIFDFVISLEEPVDMIVYSGDDVGRFQERGVNFFTDLASYTRQKRVLAVVGNDDFPIIKSVLQGENVHDLHEMPFVHGDFAFMGLEASTKGPAIIKYSENQVKKHLLRQFSQVKGKRLIVVSHTPPFGILDRGIRFAEMDEGSHHIGSTSLREFLLKKKVELVICGHCHSNGGLPPVKLNGCSVVNVASHDSINSKGNFALIDIDLFGRIEIEWHDTFDLIDKSSLSYLHSVGPKREAKLKAVGIKTVDDLARVKDVDRLAAISSFSPSFLRRLRIKAKSVVENKVYQIAPFHPPSGNIIFFDIETDIACRKVWLIGVLKNGRFRSFYADTWKEENRILRKFIKFLQDSPNSVLVSFSGTNFDKNVVQRALVRLGLDSDIFFSFPHIDLCQALRTSFIFPNQSFALKNLGKHLKYPFKHQDLDGFLVAINYQEHLEQGHTLDAKYFEYNEDDVRALPFIINKIARKELEIQKELLEETYPKIPREAVGDVADEIEILRNLRSEGYTLQQLADKFGRSIYYVYSRLNPKYRPAKSNKPSSK